MHLLKPGRLTIILAACGMLACGSPQDADVVPFDSLFHLEEEVVLRDDPMAPLGAPYGLTIWQDRLVILDQMLGNAKVFDFAGGHLLTLGRRGEGPGEFLWPISSTSLPDGRLAIYDAALLRMSFFGADGKFEESWSSPVGIGRSIAALPDGRFAMAGSARLSRTGAETVHVVSSNGELVASSGFRALQGRVFESNMDAIRLVAVGNVIVSLAIVSNEAQFFDVDRLVEWSADIGSEVYQPVEWLDEMPEGLNGLQDWNNRQMLVFDPVAVDSNLFLVSFIRSDPTTGQRLRHYVVADLSGRTVALTSPSSQTAIQASHGSRLIGYTVSDDGTITARFYRLDPAVAYSDDRSGRRRSLTRR